MDAFAVTAGSRRSSIRKLQPPRKILTILAKGRSGLRGLMAKLGEHAVVLGASMGGLLAARVLADFYGMVTVFERDVLPHDPANRRGVPQGRHVHALLNRGAQLLDELFPGFLNELVAAGATVLDDGDPAK